MPSTTQIVFLKRAGVFKLSDDLEQFGYDERKGMYYVRFRQGQKSYTTIPIRLMWRSSPDNWSLHSGLAVKRTERYSTIFLASVFLKPGEQSIQNYLRKRQCEELSGLVP